MNSLGYVPRSTTARSKRDSVLSFFLCVCGMGFELKALSLQSSHSTAWATPPALFAPVILEIGSDFCPGQPGPQTSYFTLPTIAGVMGTCHHAQLPSLFPWGWGSPKLFCLGWPGTVILPMSASQVAKITDRHFQRLSLWSLFNWIMWLFIMEL
jgi:hypothetical protein